MVAKVFTACGWIFHILKFAQNASHSVNISQPFSRLPCSLGTSHHHFPLPEARGVADQVPLVITIALHSAYNELRHLASPKPSYTIIRYHAPVWAWNADNCPRYWPTSRAHETCGNLLNPSVRIGTEDAFHASTPRAATSRAVCPVCCHHDCHYCQPAEENTDDNET